MFCLRFVSLCLLLVVAFDVSSGVNLNTQNFEKFAQLKGRSQNSYKYLIFSRHYIETIAEDTFKNCVNIRQLFVYKNPVSVIPKNLLKFNKNLRHVIFQTNQIATLHPNTFASQKSLVQLFLDENYLTDIDEDLFRHNTNLTRIRLSHNRLTQILPNTFETLVHLKEIYLDNNRISSLPRDLFAHNSKLYAIMLNSNRLKALSVSQFWKSVNLKYLLLQNNRLSYFNMYFLRKSPQLADLSLYNNDLTEIDYYYHLHEYWPKFNYISLNGNNFKCSYLQLIYDYYTEKGIAMTMEAEEKTKHPEDNVINGLSCIADCKYATVRAARINAPDAPFEDVLNTYTAPPEEPKTTDAMAEYINHVANQDLYKEIEGYYHEQKACEEGHRNFTFVIDKNCDLWSAY